MIPQYNLHVPDKKHLALNQYKTKCEAVTYHYPGMEKTVTERNKGGGNTIYQTAELMMDAVEFQASINIYTCSNIRFNSTIQ